jgi:hypothetical protein
MADEFINYLEMGAPVDNNTSFEFPNDTKVSNNVKNFLSGFNAKLPEEQQVYVPFTPNPELEDKPKFNNYSIDIGDTRVIPTAKIEGSIQNNARIPLGTLDGEEIYGARDRKRAFGNVGLDFVTPTSMVDNVPTTFGVGASGQYYTQEDKYPEVLKQFNVPDSQKFGNGLTVDQLNAYLKHTT